MERLPPPQRPLSKRIPKEIADAQSEAMRGVGIYYWANEADTRLGRAMILGPKDTPYADCPLVFNFKLPDDYPFTSPAVKFVTSDGRTRFHPNLYVEGKVCLSILGTWTGPSWSAAMSISTVLSSIQSLLEANPITNEPSYEKYALSNPVAQNYAHVVEYHLTALCVRDLLRWKAGRMPPQWKEFEDVLAERGDALLLSLKEKIAKRAADPPVTTQDRIPYAMSGVTLWPQLLAEVNRQG
jgi:ubiquitin-protein ligase